MIKPDRWIREWGQGGGVTPFEEGQVNSASYDVRVSDHWICPTRDPEEFRAPHVKLFPGEVVLASTMEYVRIPRNVACDLKLKSTLGRLWINHSLAGRRIAQLIFISMESEPDVAYGEPGSSSHYQGQRGTTPARK